MECIGEMEHTLHSMPCTKYSCASCKKRNASYIINKTASPKRIRLKQKLKMLKRSRLSQILIKIHWIDAFSRKNKYLIIKKCHSVPLTKIYTSKLTTIEVRKSVILKCIDMIMCCDYVCKFL